MIKLIALGLVLLLTASQVHAERLLPEKEYQGIWCSAHYGELEVTLTDRTRVDCLTADYAVEVDFANKWAEAIGQSLHYARMSARRPGIVIIVETPADMKHYNLLTDAVKYICPRITVWKIEPNT